MNNKDFIGQIRQIGTALKKITDNPDGGKLVLKDEKTGKPLMTFTMPKRNPDPKKKP